MKAIVVTEFGNENVLGIKDVPIPETGENEVRVRVAAAGVNPVETYIRTGKYGTLPKLPYIPGTDAAGVVDETGAGVDAYAPGDRVFVAASGARRNTGTYADYVVCDAEAVRPLAPGMPFSQGAGLGVPGLAATDALFTRSGLKAGETVLVHGATGGVGTLAVQLARKAGATVYGTAGDAEGEKLVTDLGAHKVFNHRDAGYLQLIEETSGCGPDVIIEMLANVNLANDLSILAPRGRIVIVGSRGNIDFAPRDAMAKDAAILGMMVNNMTEWERRSNLCILAAALENGLQVVVSREEPLEEAPRAHSLVIKGGQHGKVVLTTEFRT